MIQLKIKHMDHKAILTVPTEYERVTLALWTLGLDRDPEKYTLRQLDAEFTYTTEEESQMMRLIDPRSSLMNTLCLLSEMVYPPYPVGSRYEWLGVYGSPGRGAFYAKEAVCLLREFEPLIRIYC